MKMLNKTEVAFGSLLCGSMISLRIAQRYGSQYLEQYQLCGDLFRQYGTVPHKCIDAKNNFHYHAKISFISSALMLVSICALAYPYFCKKQPNTSPTQSPSLAPAKVRTLMVQPVNNAPTRSKMS